MTTIEISGIDNDQLTDVLARGVDHGGNPIAPFTDLDGGWPLRCCLRDSRPGDRIAIIAWRPFEWTGPYAETGPIVVHAGPCPGLGATDRLPAELDARAISLRPYDTTHQIAYDRVRHVAPDHSLTELVKELLEHPDIDVVHGRNVT